MKIVLVAWGLFLLGFVLFQTIVGYWEEIATFGVRVANVGIRFVNRIVERHNALLNS